MQWTHHRKLAALLLFHAAWGFVLWLSISKYGLGVSTDSVDYLFAGKNLAAGKGLVSYDGSPYYLWPPFYPMLIAFFNILGLGAFTSAHIIQFAAFALIAYFSSVLFLKIFDLPFALLAAFLLDTGTVVVSSFQMAGTDYLFILFPILLTLLAARYANSQNWTHVISIGLIAALGMLLRYIGYTLVLAGLLAVYRYTNGSPLKRILRAASAGSFALPPFLWMLHTWTATTGQRRAPLPLFDYIKQFTSGILDWFISPPNYTDVNFQHLSVVWIPISGLILIAILLSRKEVVFTPYTAFILAHGLLYTVFIFVNAKIAYFNRLDGRFLLPVYPPLIILCLLVISRLRTQNVPAANIISAFLIFAGTLQVQHTMTALRASVNGDIPLNFYNTREWNENKALQFWRQNPPHDDYILLSNYDAGVAFHTDHAALPSPRRTEIYGTDIIPLSTYEDEMFEAGRETYLIWIEPNTYRHVYEPLELAPIANITTLFKSRDGAVFKLSPRH